MFEPCAVNPSPAELVVHANADQILSQSDADGNWGTQRVIGSDSRSQAGGCGAVDAAVAEIDIEPFDLGGLVIGKCPLDTGPSCPPGLRVGGCDPLKFVCTLAKAPPAVRKTRRGPLHNRRAPGRRAGAIEKP
jgi:hypothetical protein